MGKPVSPPPGAMNIIKSFDQKTSQLSTNTVHASRNLQSDVMEGYKKVAGRFGAYAAEQFKADASRIVQEVTERKVNVPDAKQRIQQTVETHIQKGKERSNLF